jgi:hypothetical protein
MANIPAVSLRINEDTISAKGEIVMKKVKRISKSNKSTKR